MNISRIKLAIVAAIACFSASALAAEADTAYFKIGQLEGSSASADAFRVYPTGYTLPSNGCTKNDFAEVKTTNVTLAELRMFSKILMGAFAGSHKIKLHLNGCGITGRPAYESVSVDRSQ